MIHRKKKTNKVTLNAQPQRTMKNKQVSVQYFKKYIIYTNIEEKSKK